MNNTMPKKLVLTILSVLVFSTLPAIAKPKWKCSTVYVPECNRYVRICVKKRDKKKKPKIISSGVN